jgi:hypothetical protein
MVVAFSCTYLASRIGVPAKYPPFYTLITYQFL